MINVADRSSWYKIAPRVIYLKSLATKGKCMSTIVRVGKSWILPSIQGCNLERFATEGKVLSTISRWNGLL